MSTKSFLFIGSWMQPLKALPLQERWNVIEAIVEYSISGILSKSLDVMENIAFGFIRNEIDRMKHRRSEVSEKRRTAANTRWGKEQSASKQTVAKATSNELPDANACKGMQSDAPYHIESSESVSESKSESKSESESENKSSSTSSGVRVRGIAGNETPYDDSQLLLCPTQEAADAIRQPIYPLPRLPHLPRSPSPWLHRPPRLKLSKI